MYLFHPLHQGIVLGEAGAALEIERVGKEEGRLSRYAIVKPSQDLSKIEEVLCIIR